MSGRHQPTCRLILFDIKKKCGRLRLNTVPPTHRPLLCQPNHDKHSAAPGSAAFGLVVSGLAVCCLGLLATVDCCGFSIGWFGGVGPVSCHLCQILPQQVSEFLAAVSGKRVLRRWVRRLQFGSCRIQAASGPPSRHLSPQVSPRQQNPVLPNPMRGKPRVCPCRSRQTQQSTN